MRLCALWFFFSWPREGLHLCDVTIDIHCKRLRVVSGSLLLHGLVGLAGSLAFLLFVFILRRRRWQPRVYKRDRIIAILSKAHCQGGYNKEDEKE